MNNNSPKSIEEKVALFNQNKHHLLKNAYFGNQTNLVQGTKQLNRNSLSSKVNTKDNNNIKNNKNY